MLHHAATPLDDLLAGEREAPLRQGETIYADAGKRNPGGNPKARTGAARKTLGRPRRIRVGG
jgi:hypothetical protein